MTIMFFYHVPTYVAFDLIDSVIIAVTVPRYLFENHKKYIKIILNYLPR